MKRKGLLKNILSIAFVFLFIFINIQNTYAYTGNSSGGYELLPGVIAPHISVDGEVAYCLNLHKDFPLGNNYPTANPYADAGMVAILYHGYPVNKSGLQQKYGLSATQARYYTQVAVWQYIGEIANKDRGVPYLRELLQKAYSKDVGGSNFQFSKTHIDAFQKLEFQETEVINTSGASGTFTFPSDENVWSVDVNGNRKNTFNIGESFIVRAIKSYNGTKNIQINTSIAKPAALKYNAASSNYQSLVKFKFTDQLLTPARLSITFTGTGKIKICKMGEDGKVVPHTKFITSYNEDFSGETWTYETGEDGYTREIDGWDVGKTVYVKELEVPEPYVISSEVQKVTIVGGQTHTFTFTNELIKGRVEINKEDSEIKGLKIPNVEFGIYDENNTLVEKLTTDENGYAISSLIKYGDYTLKEISTNDNYILSDKVIDIQIREHKKTYTYNIVNDAIKGKLQIVKIDSKDVERAVVGAVFDVVAEDVFGVKKGTVVDTITTDKNGFAFTKDLRKGRYYAVEKYVSDEYLLNNSKYYVNIIENEKIEIVRIKNEPVKLRLRILKYDENTKEKKAIEGTVFKIVNADTKEDVEFTEFIGIRPIKRVEFTTDENGEIVLPQELRAGNYKLVEIKATRGYKGIEDIEFRVDRNTKYDEIELLGKVHTISVGNERIKANLKLIKVDKNTKERLKGVTFKIKGIDGFMKGEEIEVTTDENGEVTLEGLYYGKYSIKEIKGADGYLEYDKEIEFDVEEDNKEIVIEIENEKIPEIISKATGEKGTKEIYETEKIKEAVEISNLIKGNTYKIIAKMINKATGEVISMQEREFTASVEIERLEFIFNAKGLSGKTIVITDELYKDGKLIANHTDLENKEQTVKIKEKPIPKTGVDSKRMLYIGLIGISMFSLMVLIRKKIYG